MTEVRSNVKVKDIVMGYQQYLRSVSNPIPSRAGSPMLNEPVHRKPLPNLSYYPSSTTPSALQRSVTKPVASYPSSLSTTAASPTATTVPPVIPTSPSQPTKIPSELALNLDTGTLTQIQIDTALQSCLNILNDAITYHDKRPFSALLLAPDAFTILLTHNSISHVQHAESELARLASLQYSIEYLSKCTLVSTWEPCAMCAGTIYWAGIGRLLYAASEKELQDLTGKGNKENMTMNLPCRTVFDAGQRPVEVIGPVPIWEEQVVNESRRWWERHQSLGDDIIVTPSSMNTNGTKRSHNGCGSNRNSTLMLQPEEPVMSSIGEDGEYKAELKVDWF